MKPFRRILVVEDDAGLRLALERLLEAAGYEADTYGSAEAAAEGDLAAADCFVLDVQLPGISGPDLRDQLKLRGFGAPVIFISARDPAVHGDATWLAKPFTGRALLDTLVQVASRRP